MRISASLRRTSTLIACLAIAWAAPALASVPELEMPRVIPVPPTQARPLSSAERVGTEYADLTAAGYVEEEFYLQGVAPAITAAGESVFNVPYITRILVRRPKDPARFNGTVVIEPFTWIGERGAGWILTKDYLIRNGYADVAYTLNINKPEGDPKIMTDPDWSSGRARPPDDMNLDFMRRFDYARYSPLGLYYDPRRFLRGALPDPFVPQSQGIGAELAWLLKSNRPDGPLRALKTERVYVNSWAVTAQVWMDYLDQGRHQQWRLPDGRPLIDAYMLGKMEFGSLGGEVVRVPRQAPREAPFVNVYSQSELMTDVLAGTAAPEDSDDPQLRFYELTGVPHLRPADLGTEEIELRASDIGKENDPQCVHLYEQEPEDVLVSALLAGMDTWVREGKPMPRAPRVQRKGTEVVRDLNTGNLLGGARPPWITVPAAAYMTEAETHCGLVYDTKVPYDAQRLRAMYGNFAEYQRRFERAKLEAIQQRFLLPEDARKVPPIATAEDFRPRSGPSR